MIRSGKVIPVGLLSAVIVCLLFLFLFPRLMSVTANAAPRPGENQERKKVDRRELHQLFLERRQALQEIVAINEKNYKGGLEGADELQQARIGLLRGDLDLCETPQQRIDTLEKIVRLCQEREKMLLNKASRGYASEIELSKAKVARLEAQINLVQARLALLPTKK